MTPPLPHARTEPEVLKQIAWDMYRFLDTQGKARTHRFKHNIYPAAALSSDLYNWCDQGS